MAQPPTSYISNGFPWLLAESPFLLALLLRLVLLLLRLLVGDTDRSRRLRCLKSRVHQGKLEALCQRDQGHFGTPDKSHFGTHREAPVKRHFGTHRRQFGTPTDLWNTRGLGRELRGGWDDNVHLPCTTQVNHQHCYAFLHIPPIRPHTQRRHPHRLLSHAFPPAS